MLVADRRRVMQSGALVLPTAERVVAALGRRGQAVRALPTVESITLQQAGPSTSVAHFLAQAGVPVLPEGLCTELDTALDFATRHGFPVVLKVVSPDIPHKSEVGGVALHLTDARALADAWRDMRASVSRLAPRATITAYSVQPMLSGGFELIVGCSVDPELGRVLMVGAGGIWAEILDDVRFLALPASRAEIASALQSLRIAPILNGARGQPPLDVDAACAVIYRLAQQFFADPGIAEIDLNPLLVRPQGQGVMALDVLVVASSTRAGRS
jgi:succinyl-CoA synthetase beta subunit